MFAKYCYMKQKVCNSQTMKKGEWAKLTNTITRYCKRKVMSLTRMCVCVRSIYETVVTVLR